MPKLLTYSATAWLQADAQMPSSARFTCLSISLNEGTYLVWAKAVVQVPANLAAGLHLASIGLTASTTQNSIVCTGDAQAYSPLNTSVNINVTAFDRITLTANGTLALMVQTDFTGKILSKSNLFTSNYVTGFMFMQVG